MQEEIGDLRAALLTLTMFVTERNEDSDALFERPTRRLQYVGGRGKRLTYVPARGKKLTVR